MPPASPLAIATSSVQRLIKEEASYHRELEQQTKRLQKLESEGPAADDEGNHAFLVKQEVCGLLPKFCIVDPHMCMCYSAKLSTRPRRCFRC